MRFFSIARLFKSIRVSKLLIRRNSHSSHDGKSLVVFDKDGTIICFHTMWTPWVTGIAKGLERGTGLEHAGLSSDVYRLLGVSSNAKQVGPGLLAEATMPEIKGRLSQLLSVYGFESRIASEILEAVWHDNENIIHADAFTIRPIIDHLPELFKLLKSHNFKIAVCTADGRRSTERTLKHLQLSDLVDGVVCGDDQDSRPKPNPYNVLKLCRELEVPARRTYVVGDTLADMRMGKESNVAARIAVLSGIGTFELLAPYATHVVDDIGDLVPILIDDHLITSHLFKPSQHVIGRHRFGTDTIDYSRPFLEYLYPMKQLLMLWMPLCSYRFFVITDF